MKILVLTSIYPSEDISSAYTPIVHYFTKEWANQSHNVQVVHSFSRFPKIFYLIAKILGVKFLSSRLGYTVMDKLPKDASYILEGVSVSRFSIKKLLPHRRYSKRTITKQFNKIIKLCEANSFVPDVIIGHWLNPQLELINILLKQYPSAKTALTLHEEFNAVKNLYPNNWSCLLNSIDKIGARNYVSMRKFLEDSGLAKDKLYACLSGLPSYFLEEKQKHIFTKELNQYCFVGTLFKRKYPEALLEVVLINKESNFSITYVGDGEMSSQIKQLALENNVSDKVNLLGKIPRQDIVKVLKNSDFFVMISKNEVYGLVYLEAMAQGCIVIASKDEGFDGIIKDGQNGFLCESGNKQALAELIDKIKKMPTCQIEQISQNAIDTAFEMTDANCAKNYLEDVLK